MSTLRQDPTTRQWVILAPKRASRPHDQVAIPRPAMPTHDPACPFCPGNEEQTPPEISRVPDHPWQVRVVPNLYAALSGDGETERSGPPMFREMPGVGAAEVVVESPAHDARLDEMSSNEVEHVLRVWRERYRALMAQDPIQTVIVFKNFGALAGTSLAHAHSQILGMPVFSPRLLRRMDIASQYFDATGHCLYDDMVEAEREAAERVVTERGCFVSFEPYASGSPFETWIAPICHASSYGDLRDDQIPDLAWTLSHTLRAMRYACGDPDFNLIIYSAPMNGQADDVFLWHMKIIPRLTSPAGFELGSGMGINTVAPEDAAALLRERL